MVSPDSELRYRPNPELLPSINGDFTGKDIVSLTQFDRTSIGILLSEAARMEAGLSNGAIPQVLKRKDMFSCLSMSARKS